MNTEITGNEPINVTHFRDGEVNATGLTKREYFFAAALQGLLANPAMRDVEPSEIVEAADVYSILLIRQLNK